MGRHTFTKAAYDKLRSRVDHLEQAVIWLHQEQREQAYLGARMGAVEHDVLRIEEHLDQLEQVNR